MKKLIALAFLFYLYGCSTTATLLVEKALPEQYTNKANKDFKTILVCSSPSVGSKKNVEDQFVQLLKTKGFNGISCNDFFDGDDIEIQQIENLLKDNSVQLSLVINYKDGELVLIDLHPSNEESLYETIWTQKIVLENTMASLNNSRMTEKLTPDELTNMVIKTLNKKENIFSGVEEKIEQSNVTYRLQKKETE